jgi:hypothetical protein
MVSIGARIGRFVSMVMAAEREMLHVRVLRTIPSHCIICQSRKMIINSTGVNCIDSKTKAQVIRKILKQRISDRISQRL